MVVVREVDIVIICMLNHYLNHSKDNYFNKCILNILNSDKKKDQKVVKMILEEINEKIKEEIEEIKDQGLEIIKEKWKKEIVEGQDHHLLLQEIHL